MTHQCKVQCHTMDIKTAEDLGIEDNGKWLPFVFSMDIVDAVKVASDEESSSTYNCTTIYINNGNTFIIDTPYEEFFKKFVEYNTFQILFKNSPPPSEDDDLKDFGKNDDLDL